MYINKNEIENHTKNILNNYIKKEIGNSVPKIENTGFNQYGTFWMSAISVDIRGFKEMVNLLYRPAMIKLLQAFTSSLIKIMKENDNFRTAYVNGDEVIGTFAADTKTKVTTNIDTSILCNSFVNYLFPKILKQYNYPVDFKAGIGMWTSNDNSLVRYGQKYSQEDSHSTVIGSVINWASFLSKKANKNYAQEILFNEITQTNSTEERYKTDSYYYSNINGENTYGLFYRYDEYTE